MVKYMKIVVAGPLPTKNGSGGVAVVTENLAKEFVKLGNEVIVLSKDAPNYHRVQSFEVRSFNIHSIKYIKKERIDLIISCLDYSFFMSFINLKCYKIHLLHGFPEFKDYSMIKLNLMHLADKVIEAKFDKILANSEFTGFINKQIYNLKVKGTYKIGLDDYQLNSIGRNNNIIEKRSGLLYVGRIIKAKNIDLAINAFLESKINQKFKIVGYGSELNFLKTKYSNNFEICFTGYANHDHISKYYRQSKVFISLNPSEPFGITYLEALANGLYVIAPNTGGQVDFLKKFPGRYSLVNVNDINSIVCGIEKGFNSMLRPLDKEELLDLSYKNTCKDIIESIDL